MDIYRNDVGVFYLYDSNGILLGKPNTEVNTPLVLRWFSSGEKYGREEVWPKDFSTNLNILQKGYYYTMFSKAFDFTGQRLDANTSKNTDTLTFRIDFQIK